MDAFRILLAIILVAMTGCITWLSVKLDSVREDAEVLDLQLESLQRAVEAVMERLHSDRQTNA